MHHLGNGHVVDAPRVGFPAGGRDGIEVLVHAVGLDGDVRDVLVYIDSGGIVAERIGHL